MIDAVDAYLLLNAAAQLFEKAPSDLNETEWKEAVALAEKESLLQQKILDSEQAVNVAVSEDEIANARAELEGRYPSRREFLEDIARNGMNESTLSDSLANSLKVEKTMHMVAEAVSVSDAEVESFYSENTSKFEHPELREARHILITINNEYPENRKKAVRARLKKVLEKLHDKPDAFAELAMRHSECPTALEGGVLGKLPEGKLYPELDRQLFKMAEGEVSDLVESPMGLHILRCDRIHPAGLAPLQEVDQLIREHLLKPRISKVQKQWIRGLFAGEAER
ncbi:MAG TPA: nitrogen fixation protein NifM [Mariprofundaceae bacterium]|nr:nitrogen fixation protein NifM [Mariprofundaceae bacterium]